jgi:hypothetical protein
MNIDLVFNNRKNLIGTQVSVKGCLSNINNEWWIVDTIAEVKDSVSRIRLRDSVRPSLAKLTWDQHEDIAKQRVDAFLKRFEEGEFPTLSKDDINHILRDRNFESINRLHQAQAEDAVIEHMTSKAETTISFFNSWLTYISARLINVRPLVWSLAEVHGHLIEDEQGIFTLSDISFLLAANDSISIAMPQMLLGEDDALSVYDLMESRNTHANHEVRLRGYLVAQYILTNGEAAQKIYSLAPNQLYMWIENPPDQSIYVGDKNLIEFLSPFEEVIVGGVPYLFTDNVIIKGKFQMADDKTEFLGQLADISEVIILGHNYVIQWNLVS